jgi:hypothetical protein
VFPQRTSNRRAAPALPDFKVRAKRRSIKRIDLSKFCLLLPFYLLCLLDTGLSGIYTAFARAKIQGRSATPADEPGVAVVGEVSDDSGIPDQVHQTLHDLLVIALHEPAKRPHLCDRLLRDHPKLRIIAVASQLNYSVFYWASFDIHCNEIEFSEQGILNAVRNITATGVGELV